MRTPAGKLFAAATIALSATLAPAQTENLQPQMTPGQKAEQAKTCTFIGSWNDPIKKAPIKARMTTRGGCGGRKPHRAHA